MKITSRVTRKVSHSSSFSWMKFSMRSHLKERLFTISRSPTKSWARPMAVMKKASAMKNMSTASSAGSRGRSMAGSPRFM